MDDSSYQLLLSLVALAVGPLARLALRGKEKAEKLLHYAITIAVLYLVVVHVIPEAATVLGHGFAWPIALAGMLMPYGLERLTGRVGASEDSSPGRRGASHLMMLALAAFALVLHAVADGVALGLPEAEGHGHDHGHSHGDAIGWAVVLHRVPVGAAAFELFHVASRPLAFSAFLAVVAATLVGFYWGAPLFGETGNVGVAAFQAFAGGILLHVLVHPASDRTHGGHGHGH